jgi:hypothetical protein
MGFRVTNMIPGDVVFYKHNRDYKGIVLKVSDTLVEVLWLGFDESEWMPHYSLDVV